jgi:hypothetical protein
MAAPLKATTVISATHHLHGRFSARGGGATAAEIAKHVRAEESDVLVILRHLKARRIFDDRRRGGERRWFPWDAVG